MKAVRCRHSTRPRTRKRTRALVLFHPEAKGEGTDDLAVQRELSDIRQRWGTQEFSDELIKWGCPSLYPDEKARRWFANSLRVGASPSIAHELNRAYFETDLTDVLPAVRTPTLILYRRGRFDEEAKAFDVVSRIPGAQAMRVSGEDFLEPWLSLDIAEEIERFVAGEEAPHVPETVLTTLMFTDLFGSTERANALGDRAWLDLLHRHHAIVRRELARFRGEERDTAGDGFFATFDGPARAMRAGQAIIPGVQGLGLEMRIGIHVGECELHDRKPTGIAVNTAARVAQAARPGEVLVTRTARDLVAGADLSFADRGEHDLKGVPGSWKLYALGS
jgi:class 3 adenylate cyclase